MTDPATIRFRLALPSTLFSASPPLAALHAARARTLHPDLIPRDFPACAQCGSLLVQHPRSFRNKKRSRILRCSCPICGAVIDRELPTATFPPTRSHGVLPQRPLPRNVPSPSSPLKSISTATLNSTPKSRPKKKSGLQHLLARNRENEEKERQKQKQYSSQFGNLAMFLSDLN